MTNTFKALLGRTKLTPQVKAKQLCDFIEKLRITTTLPKPPDLGTAATLEAQYVSLVKVMQEQYLFESKKSVKRLGRITEMLARGQFESLDGQIMNDGVEINNEAENGILNRAFLGNKMLIAARQFKTKEQ